MNDVLDLFNCLVIDARQRGRRRDPCLKHVDIGVVTDFDLNAEQTVVLEDHFQPLDIRTLFTRAERETHTPLMLLTKQVLHYIEVYSLDMPGLFNLEVDGGEVIVMRYVTGISGQELIKKVQELLYTNAPVKDAAQVKRIIERYEVSYDINRIVNNELRVILYTPHVTFENGDDAVRYLCYAATGETLLIKSSEVIAAVAKMRWVPTFFEQHALPLAQVFNRHKRLILAAKNADTRTAINRIARLSKTRHVPLVPSLAKTFIAQALSGMGDVAGALTSLSVRDKLRYLNLLNQKKLQRISASFKIRNGKVHTSTNRPVHPLATIVGVENQVLLTLSQDLVHLRDKRILLDPNVFYGLPVSRKQTLGNLPFGTRVTVDGGEIAAGMYWENDWGATDLDLSTIDAEGNRVGWGGSSGYIGEDIIFSGDLTDARNGAMEFMVSHGADYGLFVNIYACKVVSAMELVVGSSPSGKGTGNPWIGNPLIREKHKLLSKDSVIGFVKGKTFTVYAGRLGNKIVSSESPIIGELLDTPWTVRMLFLALGMKFDLDRQANVVYDHDLSYSSFSYDKLENMFKAA